MEIVATTAGEELERQAPDFGRMVELHKRKLYRLALNLTGNHHDAEDLLQDAFLRAYKGLKRFRGEAQFGTWLYRITVNTHIDRQRSKLGMAMKREDNIEETFPVARTHRPTDDPEAQARSSRIQEHIQTALRRLSPQQRTVFVLRHYQELKLSEIAEVLGRSEGTVKTTLFRALQRLQQELAFYRPELGMKEIS